MSDNDGVLLEDINHQLKAILEGQAAMASVPGDIREIKGRLTTVESDVKTIKAVLKDQTHEIRIDQKQFDDHEIRLTTLEQAA
jgi:DNA repair ATPase RecN